MGSSTWDRRRGIVDVGSSTWDRRRGIVHEGDELGPVRGSFGRNDAELSQMASQGIDGLGALADQKITRAEHDRCGLRLLTFHGHEAHGGALSGLTDGLGIRPVVLLSCRSSVA